MDYSQSISERHWNLNDKGQRENEREKIFIDDIIQKSHIEREILSSLAGVKTVFDGGAGAGRFSILLAKLGLNVTHFDISRPMIDKAKELAAQAGVSDNIVFIQGALEDLSMFSDEEFDMVLSFDAPISYTYPNHEEVIKNLVRITNDKILISVSSRLGSLPYILNPDPGQKSQYILDKQSNNPMVKWYMEYSRTMLDKFTVDNKKLVEAYKTGLMEDTESIKKAYHEGGTPWPVTYLFMPEELVGILQKYDASNINLAGPGAFSRSIPNEILVKIMNDEKQRKEFLEFCYEFDKQPSVAGLGKDNLLATGRKVF